MSMTDTMAALAMITSFLRQHADLPAPSVTVYSTGTTSLAWRVDSPVGDGAFVAGKILSNLGGDWIEKRHQGSHWLAADGPRRRRLTVFLSDEADVADIEHAARLLGWTGSIVRIDVGVVAS